MPCALPSASLTQGKKGLDAFPGTTLEAELKAKGIETVALAGFLTNCRQPLRPTHTEPGPDRTRGNPAPHHLADLPSPNPTTLPPHP